MPIPAYFATAISLWFLLGLSVRSGGRASWRDFWYAISGIMLFFGFIASLIIVGVH